MSFCHPFSLLQIFFQKSKYHIPVRLEHAPSGSKQFMLCARYFLPFLPYRDGVLPFSGSSAPGHGWTQDDRSPPEIKGQEPRSVSIRSASDRGTDVRRHGAIRKKRHLGDTAALFPLLLVPEKARTERDELCLKLSDSLVWFLSYHILCASFCGTGKSCDPFCIGERHFSGQRTDHQANSRPLSGTDAALWRPLSCCDSSAHRVRIENERKTACLCFCFSCNKEQIFYITMVGIDIKQATDPPPDGSSFRGRSVPADKHENAL